MDQSASDARNEELVLNLQFDNMVQLFFSVLEHRVELFRLRNSSRESIQDEPGSAVSPSIHNPAGDETLATKSGEDIPLLALLVVF